MKLGCYTCGCHFPQDFDITLTSACNFWGDHGLTNVSIDMKKEIWDWLFAMPSDKLAILERIGLAINFAGVALEQKYTFEKLVPNWNTMTEKERQDYEREHFKRMNDMQKVPVINKNESKKKILN